MKIKKLEISGFKSFVDPTVVHFDHNITCIVGPNGCGKSNIADALRWAMGEQSAKHLRGKSMEDVIFNGCETRGPHGMAEVTITFDNTDGLASPEFRDYAEIAVTRRLTRGGDNEYFINKTPVRLMDVTNLFLGTGVGTKAYSIIEQGRVGFIVSAKPEDRRYLIEEAAGITKYKVKKRAAERKMEQTRQNLLRVQDIITEIEKNLSSLKRQAQKAERYKEYRAEIRDLELWVASHRFLELHGAHRVLGDELQIAVATNDGMRMALSVREAELESERLLLHSVEELVEEAQKRAFETDNAVRLLEAEIGHHAEKLASLAERESVAEREIEDVLAQRRLLQEECISLEASLGQMVEAEKVEAEALERENLALAERRAATEEAELAVGAVRARIAEADARIARAEAVVESFVQRRREAEERLERLRTDKESLENRTLELSQQHTELSARFLGLRNGQSGAAEKKTELEATLQNLREAIRQSDQQVEKLREELGAKRSRLRSLEEIQQRFEGVGAGVRAVMTQFVGQGDREGIVGLVADRLDCPSEWTDALAGALGERLQYVVVDELAAGVSAVDFLNDGQRGRATFVSRTGPAVGRTEIQSFSWPEGRTKGGVVAPLSELVRYEPLDESLVQRLLGDVWAVESLEIARDIHQTIENHPVLVTRRGEVLTSDGRLTGGSGEDVGAHMLAIKRETRELHSAIADLDAAMGAAVSRHQELRSQIAENQAALEAARVAAHDVEIAIVKTEKDVRNLESESNRVRERVHALTQETEQLAQALSQTDDEKTEAVYELNTAKEAKLVAEEEMAVVSQTQQDCRARLEAQSAVVTEVRVRAAQASQRVASDRAAVDRLQRSMQELTHREERLRDEVRTGAAQQGELAAKLMETRETLATKLEEAKATHDSLSEVRTRYDEERERLAAGEASLRELRSRIDNETKKLSELGIRERELTLELQHLLEQMNDRHRVDVRRILGDYHAREIPGLRERTRIEELVRLVERMGEINLMAIEEYEEQSKRYDYLASQRDDLELALVQLERAIRRMNRESRRRFGEAFAAINERFQRMFPRMFGGGKGELRLTNPEDLLESGVEIVAMPPGKRLGSIELMSGGEKALTAVSLLFAIFEYKPSPFCLLDEVDAPLDEANIGRFGEALGEMTSRSQFIVVTHSRGTMEIADVLYGVTMETPGVSKLVSVELRQRGPKATRPTTTHQEVAVA